MSGRLSSILFFLFFTPLSAWAQEAAETAAEAHEGGTTMPQLDPTYYPSQWFWLAISGITLYVLMSKIALPRVSKMVDLRDAQVQRDLEQAYHLKQEAENLKIAYTRALRDADEKAQTRVDRAVKEMRDRHNTAIDQALERVNAQVAEAEQNLRAQKDAILKEMNTISEKLAANINNKIARRA